MDSIKLKRYIINEFSDFRHLYCFRKKISCYMCNCCAYNIDEAYYYERQWISWQLTL